ncbi:MAG: hypothetical protein WCF23_03115 [Candidatus Nitrosopolaris sp.]
MTTKPAMIKGILKASKDNPDKYAYLSKDVESGKKSITGAYKLLREEQRLERIQFIKENKSPETWTDQEIMLVNNLRIRPYDVWSSTLSDKEFMSNMLYFFTKPGDKVVGIERPE